MGRMGWLVWGFWLLTGSVGAETLQVAVAANFQTTARALADAFTLRSGHSLRLSSASTGILYSQILHGAGHDLLLAADSERPRRLEAEGRIVPGSRFTYAVGELVLVPGRGQPPPDPAAPQDETTLAATLTELLTQAPDRSVALANPKLAPYGAAAEATYRHLGLWQITAPSRVLGSNIAQAYQFVRTGNARLGLVARAQITDPETGATAPHWPIPDSWHPAIEQQAVWLNQAASRTSAGEFMAFLRSAEAAAIICRHGYRVPGQC